MRLAPLAALACSTLLLAACGTVQPSAAPTTGATTSSAPVSVSPTSMSASPTESPSAATSTSAPAASLITLGANGVGSNKFGTPEATVEGFLNAHLGKPDDSVVGVVCEFDSASPYARQLSYGGVHLSFQSKAKGTTKSPRTLTGWLVQLEEPMVGFTLASPLPLKTTYTDLKTAFPKGTLDELQLGEGSSFWVFTTPDGVWYRGEDEDAPSEVGAGPQSACE